MGRWYNRQNRHKRRRYMLALLGTMISAMITSYGETVRSRLHSFIALTGSTWLYTAALEVNSRNAAPTPVFLLGQVWNITCTLFTLVLSYYFYPEIFRNLPTTAWVLITLGLVGTVGGLALLGYVTSVYLK